MKTLRFLPLAAACVLASAASAADPAALRDNVYVDYAAASGNSAVVLSADGGRANLEAARMVDGQAGTVFDFGNNNHPTIVVDLGAMRSVRRIEFVYRAPAGRLDFYLVDGVGASPQALPDDGRTRRASMGSVRAMIASADTEHRSPVLSYTTPATNGFVKLSRLVNGSVGRYLVVMFTPSGGFVSDGKAVVSDGKSVVAPTATPVVDSALPLGPSNTLGVSEIRVVGDNGGTNMDFLNPPSQVTLTFPPPLLPIPDDGIQIIISP